MRNTNTRHFAIRNKNTKNTLTMKKHKHKTPCNTRAGNTKYKTRTKTPLGAFRIDWSTPHFYVNPLSKRSILRSNISTCTAQPGWRYFQNSIFSLRRRTGRLDWVDIFCWLLRYASRRRRRKGTEGERRTFLVGQRHLLSLLTIHPSCLYSVTRSRSSEKGGTISADGAIVSHLLWSPLYWTRSLSMDA